MMNLEEIISMLLPWLGKTLKDPLIDQSCGVVSPITANALIALVGSAFFAVAIYMISRILGDEREKAFAVGELQEFLATVAIFLMVEALLVLPCTAYPDPFTNLTLNAYDRAFYLLQSIQATLEVVIVYLHVPYFFLSLLDFTTTVFGVSVTSFQGVYGLVKPLFTQNVTLLSLAYVVISLLTYTFDLFTVGMLTYLLPVGLFLRSFYVTRKVGGAIIGMVMALAIIYPFVMAFFYPLEQFLRPPGINTDPTGETLSVDVGALTGRITNTPTGGLGAGSGDLKDIEGYLYNQRKKLRGRGEELIGSLSTNMAAGASLALLFEWLASKFGGFFKVLLGGIGLTVALGSGFLLSIYALAYGFMFAFLFPILVTVIVSTAGRWISALLGQELDLSNLTRLI